MSKLTVVAKSMSSLEIAELTGKEHRNVMSDIRKMLDELNIDAAMFSATYKAGRNNTSVEMIMTTGNTQIKNLNFGEALAHLKNGYCVARDGWNGKGMWLCLISSDGYKLSNTNYTSIPEYDDEPHLLPWVGMKTANSGFVPWLCSQTDMLAEDWTVLAE